MNKERNIRDRSMSYKRTYLEKFFLYIYKNRASQAKKNIKSKNIKRLTRKIEKSFVDICSENLNLFNRLNLINENNINVIVIKNPVIKSKYRID